MQYNFGAYPTMITPYQKDGSVDYETAKRYVQWYFDKGCHGVFAICQSSEIFHLSLEEKVKLNKTVYDEAQRLKKQTGKEFTVVSSGHTANTIEQQAHDLNEIYKSGTDALILITNRLAAEDESDDVWIENAEKLLKLLPKDVGLGLYECPYPYKRLVTNKTLSWCLSTGRFYFMKDTCCDSAEIKNRLDLLKGSEFKLLNANCQTLLQSLRDGGAGYCGIMCNYHPELYVWLCENHQKDPVTADMVQTVLCMTGFTENGLPYPLSAKYHMNLEGIPTENLSRVKDSALLTDYVKDCMKQMKRLCDEVKKKLLG